MHNNNNIVFIVLFLLYIYFKFLFTIKYIELSIFTKYWTDWAIWFGYPQEVSEQLLHKHSGRHSGHRTVFFKKKI